jgi:hypothetical protein
MLQYVNAHMFRVSLTHHQGVHNYWYVVQLSFYIL